MMHYTYPDRNDALTISLIDEISGKDYWEHSEQLALNWVLEVARRLPRPRRMLDLGCGTGRLLSVFAPHVDEIIAVEPDAERFAAAKTAAKNTAVPVTVLHGDVSVVEQERHFELLLCSHVIQHVDNEALNTLISAMSYHSAPGALAVVATTFTHGVHDQLTAECWQNGVRRCNVLDSSEFSAAFSKQGTLPVRLFTRNTVETLFKSAGFSCQGFRLYHYPNSTDATQDARRSEDGDDTARDAVYLFRRM